MPLLLKAEPVAPIQLTAAEQRLYTAYRNAFSEIGDITDDLILRRIELAVLGGNPLGAVNAIEWGNFVAGLNTTVDAMTKEVVRAANESARTFPKTISIPSNFTTADPRAIAFAQARAGQLIRQVSDETRKAVTETITEALRMRIDRREMVTRITRVVGLDNRQARALTRFYEKSLQDGRTRGLDFDEAVANADKLGERYKSRMLKQRAMRIARTEIVASTNAGRYLSWVEADAVGLLPEGSMKRWITAIDERTCEVCRPLDNKEVPYRSNFPTGGLMPPVHPNCRCTAVIVPAEVAFIPLGKALHTNDAFAVMLKHGTHDQSTHNPHKGGGRSEWTRGGMDYKAETEKLIAAGVMVRPLVDEEGNYYYMGRSSGYYGRYKEGDPMPEGMEIDPNEPKSWDGKYLLRPIALERIKIIPNRNENGMVSINPEILEKAAMEGLENNLLARAEIDGIKGEFLAIPNLENLEIHLAKEAQAKGLTGRNAQYYIQGMTERAQIMITVNNDDVRFRMVQKLVPFVPDEYTDKYGQTYNFSGIKHWVAELPETRTTMINNLEKGYPVVAIEGTDFLNVIADGRFKTQYETGESNGAYKPYLRRTREMGYMGVPQETPASTRPIYGYVATQVTGTTPRTSDYNADKWNVDNYGVGQYGEVRVVLKDSVVSRTSYTVPDSLDGYGLARPLGEKHTTTSIAQAGLFHDLSPSHGGLQRESYVEAQIHGGIKLSDIKEVYVLPNYPESDPIFSFANDAAKNIQDALTAKGVDIKVTVLEPRKKDGK